jgi:hypothetical protein
VMRPRTATATVAALTTNLVGADEFYLRSRR